MQTELLIVLLSLTALTVAALTGGALGLGIMRLLGRRPTEEVDRDSRPSQSPAPAH
ncbi:MAG: hypothetical protein WBM46_04225 [Polyangiales bacterium]